MKNTYNPKIIKITKSDCVCGEKISPVSINPIAVNAPDLFCLKTEKSNFKIFFIKSTLIAT